MRRRTATTLRVPRLFGVFVLLVASCGGTSDAPGSSDSVAGTSATSTTMSAVSDEQRAAAAAIGNIAAGEELFSRPLEGLPHDVSCATCHSLDPAQNYWSPTIAGMSTVAADRVDGMSDVDYLRQSILDPYAHEVEGEWASAAMPFQYPDVLSTAEIDNLVAFMLTR